MSTSLQINLEMWQTIGLIIDYAIKIVAIGFVPEGRRPSSSTAWLLAILLLPFIGLPLFLLMGSPYINRRRHRIQQEANLLIQDVQAGVPDHPPAVQLSPAQQSVVALNRRLTRMPAVAGLNLGLWTDYDLTIRRMAEAIDGAKEYVHVEIYIMAWDDTTDCFFRAMENAVKRGVTVRLLFDQVGSLKYPGYWNLGRRLTAIGVNWEVMLPLRPWKLRFRRPDLRNHRKMLIIDGERGFLGSQNMIDRSYLVNKHTKVRRQWIDAMVELEGPIVSSMDMVFATDWCQETEEALTLPKQKLHPELSYEALSSSDAISTIEDVNILQLVPSGPGYSTEPNLRMFTSLVHHAKDRLVLCSPYFIPDESLLEAITTACYRGVQVELYVSEKADQFLVHHAQSSYYRALLEAGVRIFLFPEPYVLHTKFMLSDPDTEGGEPVGVLGSSNMDMRSFGLNYEISLMVSHGNLIDELNELTTAYRRVCRELTEKEWAQRSYLRRYVDNVAKLTSALQ
ncbi:cardiolipin synthase [Corynebacterium spheniscorum]|uniref:Cardiolipin synthase n=2 Tax=Corynebacterium spheniscorum TaxID=185761 RepID=A0A1I2TIL0_9CORY|nr:cardiolipin synthase [Corynebacterium spheniscorum]